MKLNQLRLRQLHRWLVPLMTVPLLLTLTTGMAFQVAVISDRAADFLWLLELHRGKFGRVNLEMIYPLLNGFGLLTLLITGVIMWLQLKPQRRA